MYRRNKPAWFSRTLYSATCLQPRRYYLGRQFMSRIVHSRSIRDFYSIRSWRADTYDESRHRDWTQCIAVALHVASVACFFDAKMPMQYAIAHRLFINLRFLTSHISHIPLKASTAPFIAPLSSSAFADASSTLPTIWFNSGVGMLSVSFVFSD